MSDTANSPAFWEKNYQANRLPWDLGGPAPVFQRLADSGQFASGRMMVLGAGQGHDARLFARHRFQVTAVDFAQEAVEKMRELDDPAYPVEMVQADFFELPATWNGRYDYVLDYTSFCAILPERRGEYADLVTRLLKPAGTLIMLAFPIGERSGGPPYVVQPEAIIELFAERGFTLQHRESPPDSVPERRPYEELLLLRKTFIDV